MPGFITESNVHKISMECYFFCTSLAMEVYYLSISGAMKATIRRFEMSVQNSQQANKSSKFSLPMFPLSYWNHWMWDIERNFSHLPTNYTPIRNVCRIRSRRTKTKVQSSNVPAFLLESLDVKCPCTIGSTNLNEDIHVTTAHRQESHNLAIRVIDTGRCRLLNLEPMQQLQQQII